MDKSTSLQICGITQGTYNSWVTNPEFSELYRRRDEFSAEYKQEAIQLLRRDNQLAAVLLEEKLISKMKQEVEDGDYNLIRTNLAKEVYTRLLNDLDYQPTTQNLTWEAKIAQIFTEEKPQIGEGEVVDAQFETVDSPQAEHQESQPAQEGEQGSGEAEEANQES